MARQTNLNVAPYFDDYDESKRFHQILFKAGQTVQARELTQLQDILSTQIESIGSHFFKNGSSVIGGDFTIKTKLKSIAFNISNGSLPTTLDNDNPITIKGSISGLEARISKLTDSGAFYEITNSGFTGEVEKFNTGEPLIFTQTDDDITTEVAQGSELSQGLGSYARVENGIYYIRGMFVSVIAQEIIISETDNVSKQVGFNILEEIIGSSEDDSLNSNALDYPNYRAPGADRLKVTLTLETSDIEDEEPDFVRLALVNIGEIEDVSNQVQYSELEKVLAQRTFEESGNYSVTDFDFEIREHLNDGINGGVYVEDEGGDADLLVAVIEPGIHYVYGFRIENDTEQLVSFPKSRQTTIANNSVTSAQYGSVITVADCKGVPILNNNILYNFRNLNSEVIGTVRVFSSQKNGTDEYQLISRDVSFNTGKSWAEVTAITAVNGSSSFSGTPTVNGVLEGTDESLIFELPYSGVRTLKPSGTTDTNYSVTGEFTTVLNSTGSAVISAPFGSQFIGSFNSFSVSLQDGSGGELPVSYNLVGTPLGSGIEIDAGSGFSNTNIRAILISQKNTAVSRSKTLTTAIQSMTVSNTNKSYLLSNTDAVEIKSLRIDGVDYKNTFVLNKNQTDFSYELSKIEAVGAIPSGILAIEYTYYSHGEGDYFSIDSYEGVDYNDIESYTALNGQVYDLRDCLDFRRTISSTVDTGSIASPKASIQADIEYYLPRFVSLYVDSTGDFDASIGVSSNSADKANIPSDAMRLADLFVPSWTPTPESVLTYPIDNKRFTMRDIGQIEKRVSNIEYTTSLNLLEASASNIQVIDTVTGGDRFKNGIFADPFLDFRLMDTDLSDASIDDMNGGRLRPSVSTYAVNMQWDNGGLVKSNMLSAESISEFVFTKQPFATKSINVNPHASFSWAGFVDLVPNSDFWTISYYTPDKIINQTVNLRGSTREGIVYGKWSRTVNGRFTFGITQTRENTQSVFNEWTTTTSAGESILSTQLIPYMRAINIEFSASGLRPFTNVYPWFGNREVSNYCRPKFGVLGQTLVTDSSGSIEGNFEIPSDSGFSTGEKSFILVDNKNDPNDPNERTTFGSSSFSSGGSALTKQRQTIQTRTLGVTQRKAIEFRQVDPIAQSFTIGTKEGLFCKGVDIFMKTKSQTIPLTVEIREMENGIPTHEVVARTNMLPSDVNVSSTAALATRVNFSPSVFLKEGGEYCIVLLANTQEYQAFISDMGETVINSVKTVAAQPHTGVFFTSSNGSTWTPSQTQDLKFSLVRDVYNTELTYSYLKGTELDTSKILDSNPVSTVAGSNILTVKYQGHGCRVGDSITLSGILSDAGITSPQLNKTHIVTEVVDFDYIKVTVADTAQTTIDFGGFKVVASGGILVNLVYINVNYTEFDTSKAVFQFRYKLQATRTKSSWIDFTPSTDILLPEEGSFRSADDIEVRVGFNSDGTLSPQVDEFGFCVTMTSFRLSDTSELFTYISKPISLENPSTSGKFYIGSLLPNGSNMKLYIKVDEADDWEEISPETPVTNTTSTFTETNYNVGERSAFGSFRIKVALTGSRVNPPVLRDIRGVVLA